MVVRRDLPLGIIGANFIHAAGESSPGGLPAGTFAIALEVKDEAALKAVAARLAHAGVPHVPVYEPDAPFNGSLMAVGVVPARKEELRRYLSSLRRFQ